MLKLLGMSTILLACGFALGQAGVKLSEKFQQKLDAADASYKLAITKAENMRVIAVQRANSERLRILKQALTEATKAGDAEAIDAVSKRVAHDQALGLVDSADEAENRPLFLSAIYGVNQSWLDVTTRLNEKARENPIMKFKVTDAEFGDPAPDYPGGNTLIVRYLLKDETVLKSVYVNLEMSIP